MYVKQKKYIVISVFFACFRAYFSFKAKILHSQMAFVSLKRRKLFTRKRNPHAFDDKVDQVVGLTDVGVVDGDCLAGGRTVINGG